MGCDIHIHSELKIKGQWHHLNEVDFYRNYSFFAKLAGVRGYGPEPKGLPKNASFLTNFLSKEYGADGHSHSWISSKEYMEFIKWAKEETDHFRSSEYFGYLFGNYYEDFYEDRQIMPKELEDFRFVFWFDN